MLALSTGLGAFIGFSGMYASYFLDASSGATIVLFGAGIFLLALVYSALRERLTGIRGVTSDVVPAGAEQKTVVYD
jgi:manganese/iron transport system permease protein/iron/zinc/copper transport system permease protein